MATMEKPRPKDGNKVAVATASQTPTPRPEQVFASPVHRSLPGGHGPTTVTTADRSGASPAALVPGMDRAEKSAPPFVRGGSHFAESAELEMSASLQLSATPSFVTAAPIARQHHGPGVMGAAAAKHAPSPLSPTSVELSATRSKTLVGTAKPRVVPQPPYLLTSFVVALVCKLSELRGTIDGALRTSNIDYALKEDKWKAKCCLYRPKGFCAFVLRAFSQPSPNGETFLIEMQRRKGCHNIFQNTYDRVIAHLATAGVIAPGCSALARANFLTQSASAVSSIPPQPAPLSLSSAAMLPPPPPVTSLGASPRVASASSSAAAAARCDDIDEDTATTSLAMSVLTDNLAGAEIAQALRFVDSAAFVDAFVGLDAMLSSNYDDVACSAAQSIAALSVSKRVRHALGSKALKAYQHSLQRKQQATNGAQHALALQQMEASRQSSSGSNSSSSSSGSASPSPQQQQQSTAAAPLVSPNSSCSAAAAATAVAAAASPSASSSTPSPRVSATGGTHGGFTDTGSSSGSSGITSDDIAALHIFATLLLYVEHSQLTSQSANAGIECRTACAMALALLAEDEKCAEVMLRYSAPARLVVVPALPESTPPHVHAALRRESLRTVAQLVRVPSALARDAAGACSPLLRHVSHSAGADPAFDAHLSAIVEGVQQQQQQQGGSGASPRDAGAASFTHAFGAPQGSTAAAASLAAGHIRKNSSGPR